MALDEAHVAFLVARISDEIDAALARRNAGHAEEPEREPGRGTTGLTRTDEGLRVLTELRTTLQQGQTPDQMSIDLLTVAYSRHPEFRASWNRWRTS